MQDVFNCMGYKGGKHAHACALKMCTTHGCVSLHMGKPRDYNLVKYMGFPEQENRADISCRHLS